MNFSENKNFSIEYNTRLTGFLTSSRQGYFASVSGKIRTVKVNCPSCGSGSGSGSKDSGILAPLDTGQTAVRYLRQKAAAAYMFVNERFLRFVKKPADEVTRADIERYLLFLAEKGRTAATRHLAVSSPLKVKSPID